MRRFTVDRETLRVERQVSRPTADLLRVDQRFTAPAAHAAVLVTGRQWLYADVQVVSGALRFANDAGVVMAPERFAMLLPPGSLVRIEFDGCVVESRGYLSRAPLHLPSNLEACLFDAAAELPESVTAVGARVATARRHIPIGTAGMAHPAARRAKRLLDGAASDDAGEADTSIASLARALGLSREALSRAFKATFGLSPLQYRLRTRVMDAVLLLGQGEAILRVALDVGFRDLSRFYQQFRALAAATPRTYVDAASQNAKPTDQPRL
jgi:AraC-like DNA-binding protein